MQIVEMREEKEKTMRVQKKVETSKREKQGMFENREKSKENERRKR